MKKHLKSIERLLSATDKSIYDYILDQSERTTPIDGFNLFVDRLSPEDFMLYPNTSFLKNDICSFYNINYDQLFLTNGSDVAIKSVFETFTTGGRVITSDPSFPMYKVYCSLYQCEYLLI